MCTCLFLRFQFKLDLHRVSEINEYKNIKYSNENFEIELKKKKNLLHLS